MTDDALCASSCDDRAGGLRPEPAAQSQPAVAHPSRVDATKAYMLGKLDERKAISRFFTVRVARAMIHANEMPCWAWRRREKALYVANIMLDAAQEIELGKHNDDQAVWIIDLADGVIIGREAFKRDSDRSGAADETRSGSAEGESAGRTSASPVSPEGR